MVGISGGNPVFIGISGYKRPAGTQETNRAGERFDVIAPQHAGFVDTLAISSCCKEIFMINAIYRANDQIGPV